MIVYLLTNLELILEYLIIIIHRPCKPYTCRYISKSTIKLDPLKNIIFHVDFYTKI